MVSSIFFKFFVANGSEKHHNVISTAVAVSYFPNSIYLCCMEFNGLSSSRCFCRISTCETREGMKQASLKKPNGDQFIFLELRSYSWPLGNSMQGAR